MNERTDGMDDRFDRRELLLHLGEMLEASSRLASATGATIAQCMDQDHSLREFRFLSTIAPTMTVAEFNLRVVRAFSRWPQVLLQEELDRNALASAVLRELYESNRDGWNTYIAQMREAVPWFGLGLDLDEARDKLASAPAREIDDKALAIALIDAPASNAETRVRGEKKGWPWPDPEPLSA